MNDSSHSTARVELDDIQGLARFGFKNHIDAVFLLLKIKDPRAARAWLAQVSVASAVTSNPPPSTVLQVALTSQGLQALQVEADLIDAFSPEFITGMAGDSSRSRRLGDLGPSSPSQWQWGVGDRVPHAAVLLYALPGKLHGLQQAVEAQSEAGFQIIARLETSNMGGREPFGFVDGISQPDLDWNRQRAVEDVTQLAYTNLSCLGEFLLGYPNEYGLYTPRPLLAASRDPRGILARAEDAPELCDLGRNGSYLVIRQLRQDVCAFWRTVDHLAGGMASERELLAGALVGRARTGEPLEPIIEPASTAAGLQAQLNAFNYASDADGLRCPLGAHIRRANPRNGDFPPGTRGTLSRLVRMLGIDSGARRQDLVASTRLHRLLRRGREYGIPITPEQALRGVSCDADRGLHFICLSANLQRQFEFVQSAWLMNAKFNGLPDEGDPLLGNRLPNIAGMPTDRFSLPHPDGPNRLLTGLPPFITVVGGAYFFLPGIRALRFLSGARP
jgi:deferrochelatase/peroxidase EfeB